jgi:TPR repeat protein
MTAGHWNSQPLRNKIAEIELMAIDSRQFFPISSHLAAAAVLLPLLMSPACTNPQTAGTAQTSTAKNSQHRRIQPPEVAESRAETTGGPAGVSPKLADTYLQAQSGDAKAMAKLGEAYEKGKGAPEDLRQAIHWFTKSAEAGDSFAMYRLGRIYATASGVPKDEKEALNWYRKAAAAGNTEAMYDVGRAYETGSGVREDVQKAVDWYDQATLRGNGDAKAALDRLGEGFDR